jgi:hypothetical protein
MRKKVSRSIQAPSKPRRISSSEILGKNERRRNNTWEVVGPLNITI